MGTVDFAMLAILIVVFKASDSVTAEEPTCLPGFGSEMVIFKVTRKHLMPGTRLGTVGFSDCTDRTRFGFSSDDRRFMVQTDGTLMVKRRVVLHEGHQDFFIHSWDSQGRKMTLPFRVSHRGRHHGNHHQNVEHHHKDHKLQHHLTEVDSANNTESAPETLVPVLHFPKSGEGLRRKKREWVIPTIRVPENDRGPYPLKISQIRSSEDKTKKIYYSISGPGVDQPPVGLFTIDRNTGDLYLRQPLDREKQAVHTFQVEAVAGGSEQAEAPMEVVVNIIDQNDNKPIFTEATYLGEVAEYSPIGLEVITVAAEDLDDPNTDNADIRYKIMSQEPQTPPDLFAINSITGAIRVEATGLDREKNPEFSLVIQAADMKGEGLTGRAKVILTVTDSNDKPPIFTQYSLTATIEENKAKAQIITLSVTDGDEPYTPAWNAKFTIFSGDPEGLFTVTTGRNKNEGILSTAKGLDFEKTNRHVVLVTVENEVPFAVPMPTAIATVLLNVLDVNEAPVFEPVVKRVSKPEDLAVDSYVVQFTASDPDTARKQKVMYRMIRDPAGWLKVDKDTGLIKVKSAMDRESHFIMDDKYTALIGAFDNDEVPATGTGTLVIHLQHVNKNAPTIRERDIKVCNKDSAPQLLSVTDKDGPDLGAPYNVSLQGLSKNIWTAEMNQDFINLTLATELASGKYTMVLRVSDHMGLEQDIIIQATVCDCTGEKVSCQGPEPGHTDVPTILRILGGIVLLIMVVLLLGKFVRDGFFTGGRRIRNDL